MGGAIAEAKRMFDERLTQSDVLRNWWNQSRNPSGTISIA